MHQRTGTISIDGNRATITFVRYLGHPIEKVWNAVTDPVQRAVWFGPTSIEPQVGGQIETTAEGPPAPVEVRQSKGIIRVWDPPNVFEYEEESANVGKTVVRFELKAEGETTVLRLINSGLNISDAGGYAPGWHAFLDRLESLLDDQQLPDWGERYGMVQSEYT